MAANDDTFSSDAPESAPQPTSLTYFETPDKKRISRPTEYDPKTGENLTITNTLKDAPELKPIIMMRAPDSDKDIRVPLDKVHYALTQGFKSLDQLDAEQSAQQSKSKLLAGDLGDYHPSKTKSALLGAANEASFNVEPQVVGAAKGIANVLQGGNYQPAYEQGKLEEEAVNKSAQKENPNSYLAGQIVGGGAQMAGGGMAKLPAIAEKVAPYTFGTVGRNIAGGSVLGAAGGAGDAANQDLDVEEGALKGAESGALGSAVGLAGGKALQYAGKGLKGLYHSVVAPEATQGLSAGLKGENFNQPQVREEALNKAADLTGDIRDTIDEVRSLVGKQKSEHLQSLPPVDHSSLTDIFNKNIDALTEMESKTGNKERLNAIEQAKEHLKGAISTLKKNPNSAIAVDEVKQDLASPIYDTQGNYVSKSGNTNVKKVSDILESSRSDVQNFLENLLPDKLKGTNQAYKTILEAQNPQEAYDAVIPELGQIEGLTKGKRSLVIRKRLNNLADFNEDIQKNDQLPDSIKNKLNDKVSEIEDVIKRGSLANSIENASGRNPLDAGFQAKLGSAIGSELSPATNQVVNSTVKAGQGIGTGAKVVGNTIYGVAKEVYDHLGPRTQQLIRTSPEFAAKLVKSLPQTGGRAALEDFMQNNQGLKK